MMKIDFPHWTRSFRSLSTSFGLPSNNGKASFSHLLLFSCLALFLGSACGNDDEPVVEFKPCCETEPLVAEIGEGNIYIPNIFTPNGDGINDVFLIYWDDKVEEILSFTILGNLGQEIYVAENITDRSSTRFWSGRDGDFNYTGRFSYEIDVLASDGTALRFVGQACSILCEEESTLIDKANVNQCGFPAQHDGNGGYDAELPFLENSDCFPQ